MWPHLDMAPRIAPQVYSALTGVRDVKWRAMDGGGNFSAEWRSSAAENVNSFPWALELSITLATGEQYTRLFAVSAGH